MEHNNAYDYGTNIITSLKRNGKMMMLLLIFSLGMIFGALIIKNDNSVINTFKDMFITYITVKKDQSVGLNFINSFSFNSVFILFSFVLGLCAIGLPFLTISPFLKGLGVGMLSGFLYSNFALKGLGYCILILFPGLIPAVFSILISCATGMSSSYNMLLAISTNNKVKKGEISLKIYCTKFLIIIIITVFSAFLDSLAIRLFSGFFSF